jgi:hypothetical protein
MPGPEYATITIVLRRNKVRRAVDYAHIQGSAGFFHGLHRVMTRFYNTCSKARASALTKGCAGSRQNYT